MDDSHILGTQHFVDRLLLCTVQVREVHRCKTEGLCLLTGVEEITQITQTPLRLDNTIKRVEHHLITGLIEKQLDSYVLCPLHIDQLSVVWYRHHHSVTIDIADGTRKREIPDLVLLANAEETNRFSELEVMLNLLIALTVHLHHQLVKGVIIAPTYLQGIPGIATLDLPQQSHLLGLLAERLLLCLILQLEQQALLL